ncbi:hypothetical protein [Nocardia cerradoensis]|uniref:ESAT-6-like protein EsxB n=1 Tax=Nocardia cerradoensis TaxID=85688 RepID=A0A231GWI3_9NOCA|nr:hypothetical protein [Nocardia cerradoensis]NKY44817.1 hypothetical protein [Nocardia cerradoensis]OXR40851.1 hypothetical protein B7C42_07135 [Nocardia cerradoensis]
MSGKMYFNFEQVNEHHTTLKGLTQAMQDNILHLRALQEALADLLGGSTANAYQEVAGNLNRLMSDHQQNLTNLNLSINAAAGHGGTVQTADQVSARSMRG